MNRKTPKNIKFFKEKVSILEEDCIIKIAMIKIESEHAVTNPGSWIVQNNHFFLMSFSACVNSKWPSINPHQ